MQTHGRQTAGSPHILTSPSVLRAFQGSLRRVTVLPKGGDSACSFRHVVLAAQTFRSRRLKMLCEITAVEQHVCTALTDLRWDLTVSFRKASVNQNPPSTRFRANPFPVVQAHPMINICRLDQS